MVVFHTDLPVSPASLYGLSQAKCCSGTFQNKSNDEETHKTEDQKHENPDRVLSVMAKNIQLG